MGIRKYLVVYVMVIALSFCNNAAAFPFNKMIVFGDSFTDTGNAYRLTFDLIPKSPPYYEGRFSNGPVWIEELAKKCGIKKNNFENYSLGGATSSFCIIRLPYTLKNEINKFFAHSAVESLEGALFVMWIGSNDYLGGRISEKVATNRAINAIADGIERLAKRGAKYFLVFNLFDLGNTPKAREKKRVDGLTKYSNMHNEKLQQKMSELQRDYPHIKFVTFDIAHLFKKIMDDPKHYGLDADVVKHACYKGGYIDPVEQMEKIIKSKIEDGKPINVTYTTYQNPSVVYEGKCNGYLFWDNIHITGKGNEIIAKEVYSLLEDKFL